MTPIVVASSCLEHEKVRYNGQVIPSEIIRQLEPFVRFIRVCPEYEIGLGVPREPIRIVKKEGQYRLIQHNTNKDVTDDMNNFSKKFVDSLGDVDGFIFKSRSPTMGVKNIKVYSGMKGSPVIEKCGGFFASRIAEKYEGYPIEEEDRLKNNKIREHFLTKLFMFAAYREQEITEFHDNNKMLMEFYNSELAQKLDTKDPGYFDLVKQIMARPPGHEQVYEFFSNLPVKSGHYAEILKKYKNNRISFETLKEIAWLHLDMDNSFFSPYPEELAPIVDTDRQRDFWK